MADQKETEALRAAEKEAADQDQKLQEKAGEAQAQAELPWHASFPAAQSTPGRISRVDVLEMLKLGKNDFVLIDVRRIDCVGGQIRGSINLPAQSLYHTLPTLYNLFNAAGVRKVIWFCNSSNGRGPRAAGWFADLLDETSNSGHGKENKMESLVLEGGIKGWALGGDEFVQKIDGYVEANWKSMPVSRHAAK